MAGWTVALNPRQNRSLRSRDALSAVRRQLLWLWPILSLVLVMACSSCIPEKSSDSSTQPITRVVPDAVGGEPSALSGLDALQLILAPLPVRDALDQRIAAAQQKVRTAPKRLPALEALGWTLIAKARASFDPGYYTLAERCAQCMDAIEPNTSQARLLRGHALHNLHRFAQAETIARSLVADRDSPFDHGLLGDVLMEQGKLDEAIPVYQHMMDLRPGLQAYARVAHVRWLRGDLPGAVEVMEMAVRAATPNDRETAAWAHHRLAGYLVQNDDPAGGERECQTALDLMPHYAPALLLRGRLLLTRGHPVEALDLLRQAATLQPLPEYQWAWADAAREAGLPAEAAQVEERIRTQGPATDPRGTSLFLSTRGESLERALALARAELDVRQDVFTHDALAWALFARGQTNDALAELQLALAEGTNDPRLLCHALIISAGREPVPDHPQWLDTVRRGRRLLLPSERRKLDVVVASGLARSGLAPGAREQRAPDSRKESLAWRAP